MPLAWLWIVLINDLRVEWTVNPQYSYGWAVPFLCVFLIWHRIQRPEAGSQKPEISPLSSVLCPPSSILYFLFALCAFLYLPTRLVEEANPGWRLVSWALAIEVIGLTLLSIRMVLHTPPLHPDQENGQGKVLAPVLALQRFNFSAFILPVCFFLVAVPWPTFVEQPLIQGLTRLDTSITTELLGWFGIPAMPHGNVIEVATGMVGIDEACSGIRSFQATLMISLFIGEFYSLGVLRRVLCVFAGFALSFLFNLARMSLLVWVAARKGVAAIASWHDPAGVTILVACFFCLWGLGVVLQGRSQKSKVRSQKPKIYQPSSVHRPPSAVYSLALGLTAWILVTEISVETWYRWHEVRAPRATQWMVAFPTENPTFKELPLADKTRQILLYDEARSVAWSENNLNWEAFFFRWNPGRRAMHMAQAHTPEVCLTAAGHTLNTISSQEWFDVNGLRMPFSVNEVTDTPRPFYVFYCLWDDRPDVLGSGDLSPSYGNRLTLVLAGQRNPGQRSLEISVSGPTNAAEAEDDLRAELEKLIVPQK